MRKVFGGLTARSIRSKRDFGRSAKYGVAAVV